MKYKPPRERERGRRKAEPQTQGLQAPTAPFSLVSMNLSLQGVCWWTLGGGESRPGLAGWWTGLIPHLIPTPPPLPLAPPFPSSHPLLLSPHPSLFFYLFLSARLPNLCSPSPSISLFSFLSPLSSAPRLSLSTHLFSSQPFLPPTPNPRPGGTLNPPRSPQRQKVPCQQNVVLAADSVSVISQAEAAVAGGQGGGTGKMDEEYKNKMARTPGTGSRLSKVPGS